MGRQLWFAAEYEVVERANSPTREQRRGVVSGMVSILGLVVARLTVNIIISQDHRSKSCCLSPVQALSRATLEPALASSSEGTTLHYTYYITCIILHVLHYMYNITLHIFH